MTSREAFEKWFCDLFPKKYLRFENDTLYARSTDGTYIHGVTQENWETWQASRAVAIDGCIVECAHVEKFADMQANNGGSAFDDGRARGAQECAEAIRAMKGKE